MAAPAPITVAVRVYNGSAYVARALACLQAQTFTDFEAVIRDNASTDDTEQVIRAAVGDDTRFRYVRNPVNVGGAHNGNLLLAETRSPTIIWVDHDDEPHPDLLGASSERLRDDPGAVVAFPRMQVINADGEVIAVHDDGDLDMMDDAPHRRLAIVLGKPVGQVQFGLMRTEVARAAGGISTSVAGEFVLPAAMALRGRVVLSDPARALISVRQHEESSGRDRRSEAVWADPNRPFVPFPYSRSTPVLLRTVARAPLSAAERRRSYATVLSTWTRPGLRTLAGDLVRLPWDAGWVGRRSRRA